MPKKVENTPVVSMASDVNGKPTEKLTKLKAMLDEGLITQADFEAKKSEILPKM